MQIAVIGLDEQQSSDDLAGSVPALVGTPYGRILLLKIALFLVMVCVAAVT